MRQSLRYALKKLGTIENAVEIGVREGLNAEVLLRAGVKKLYLVDNYPEYEETWNDDGKSKPYRKKIDRKFQDGCKQAMLNRLKDYNGQKEFIELSSIEASNQFAKHSLDYVYIDGDHSYEAVMKDLEAWHCKVKSDGVLAGHDFREDTFPGVVKAVMEFANKYNYKVVKSIDGDWWLKEKPMMIVSYIYENGIKPYAKMRDVLTTSLTKFGYTYKIVPVSNDVAGYFVTEQRQYGISGKGRPNFLRNMLNEYPENNLIWIDLDCEMVQPVDNVLSGCDVAVTIRRKEDRQYGQRKFFESFVNTGVMFFRNNENARKFLSLWEDNFTKEECDQDGVNKLLLNYSKLEDYCEVIDIDGIRIKTLPAEVYNFFYFGDNQEKAKILHYKGFHYKGDIKR